MTGGTEPGFRLLVIEDNYWVSASSLKGNILIWQQLL